MSEAPNLHDTTDASVWAHEFCKRFTSAFCEIEGKEGIMIGEDYEATMLGWFANAIMAGVDSEARISADRIEELEAKLAKGMQVVEMIASADVDAVLGQAVDISCEILGELMEDEDDDLQQE